MSLIQVEANFVSEDTLKESCGYLIPLDERKKAIEEKLQQCGGINGAYIRPVIFKNTDHILPEDQIDFIVRGFDPEALTFSIELMKDRPFPEGCTVAMAYECKMAGDCMATVVGIYFSYLNNDELKPYGHF